MKENAIFITGILGAAFFAISSIIGGLLIEDYSHISQFISESMASGTAYGEELRFYGYIPSGIFITIFSYLAYKKFSKSGLIKIGFLGLGLFYGIATIIVAIFPCDTGCNLDFINPTLSQVIHNLIGAITYIFVPLSILLIALGFKQIKQYKKLSSMAFVCGILAMIFIGLLFSDPQSAYKGLIQRIVESIFIIFIVASAFAFKNSTT